MASMRSTSRLGALLGIESHKRTGFTLVKNVNLKVSREFRD